MSRKSENRGELVKMLDVRAVLTFLDGKINLTIGMAFDTIQI
jgi:hypothetical protein